MLKLETKQFLIGYLFSNVCLVCEMILKCSIIVLNFSYLYIARKLLLETRQKSGEIKQHTKDDVYTTEDITTHFDYMADVKIKSVDAGKPVQLKCNSPKGFSRCFFSKIDENTFYRMQPKATFHDKRLKCLCDVSISLS